MKSKPAEMSVAELLAIPSQGTELWVQHAVAERVSKILPFEAGVPGKKTGGVSRVVVVGGGTLLDKAKSWRADISRETRLIAVPSLWGSGAEVSPIVVANENGRKLIRMGEEFLPDNVAYLPELASEISPSRARMACGDSWSHAVEGFLSPLANDSLRSEIADLIAEMLDLPIGSDPNWFRLSARACRLQANASVGLVHGIAHTLEGPLTEEYPRENWGHAALCSLYLLPVLEFNREDGGKYSQLMQRYSVNEERVRAIARSLHDPVAYQAATPVLAGNWTAVLRDQCSRTNVRLVRRNNLKFFESWSCN